MLDNLDRLNEAEGRRAKSTPSTAEFHQAMRDTQEVAADIWHEARRGDLIPRSERSTRPISAGASMPP